MLVKIAAPVTSNRVEILAKVSRFSPEQQLPSVSVDGTPFIHTLIAETETAYYLSILLASPVQANPLSTTTSGEVILNIDAWAPHTVSVSVVCLSAKQALTNLSGVSGDIPQTAVDVTSNIYPVLFEDGINLSLASITKIQDIIPLFEDGADLSLVSLTGGELRAPLVAYDKWEPEEVDLSLVEITTGELRTLLLEYDKWEPEEVDLSLVEITAGELRKLLISYENWDPDDEEMDLSLVSITNGSLT